jgi:Phage protein Gp138 N-terminal domain
MTTKQPTPPSRNTANNNSLSGLIQFAINKNLESTDDMLPAKVIAYDRTTNRARVQPLIDMVDTKDVIQPRAQIASIPVLQLGGAGYVISFPIATGTLGWIKANDRDISLLRAPYNPVAPNTLRKHSFSDALFIPDTMLNGVTIASGDVNNAVFQNAEGTVKISLSGDTVTIKAPHVKIESTTLTHNNVNIGDTHTHSGVVTGGDDTGVPVP